MEFLLISMKKNPDIQPINFKKIMFLDQVPNTLIGAILVKGLLKYLRNTTQWKITKKKNHYSIKNIHSRGEKNLRKKCLYAMILKNIRGINLNLNFCLLRLIRAINEFLRREQTFKKWSTKNIGQMRSKMKH